MIRKHRCECGHVFSWTVPEDGHRSLVVPCPDCNREWVVGFLDGKRYAAHETSVAGRQVALRAAAFELGRRIAERDYLDDPETRFVFLAKWDEGVEERLPLPLPLSLLRIRSLIRRLTARLRRAYAGT